MTLRPTMNIRWRKATDEELKSGKQVTPFARSTKSGAVTFFVLEQQFLESLPLDDNKRYSEWRSVPIAENEK